MKKYLNCTGIAVCLFICSLFISCNKETENDGTGQEVSFSFNVSSFMDASLLKSVLASELSDVDKIVITIQNNDGTPTRYTASEINIQQMNGIYYSQRITLKTGVYRLTEFDLTDHNGSTIFAIPLTGSLMAQNVSTALPISFSVIKNAFTSVPLEVLSTESHTPEDFGLSRFPIADVKTFRFMIGVADAGSDKLLASKLTVSSGSYAYVQNLDTITNNIVTVRDGLASYTLTVERLGYNTYSHTFDLDSLKTYQDTIGNIPLLIELEKLIVTDYDGNVYETVVIGNQVWMKENLKVTHYRNGDPIIDGTGIGNYSDQTEPKYYFSNSDDLNNVLVYGRLYTWYAANDSRNVCPLGWHLPTDAEWTQLTDYLGGESIARYKLKETGTIHWNSPNTGATNESSFTGLPGGYASSYGDFQIPGISGNFWTATTHSSDTLNAWSRVLYYSDAAPIRLPNGNGKKLGLSVRCIKD